MRRRPFHLLAVASLLAGAVMTIAYVRCPECGTVLAELRGIPS